jgi:hypothetical protein
MTLTSKFPKTTQALCFTIGSTITSIKDVLREEPILELRA